MERRIQNITLSISTKNMKHRLRTHWYKNILTELKIQWHLKLSLGAILIFQHLKQCNYLQVKKKKKNK